MKSKPNEVQTARDRLENHIAFTQAAPGLETQPLKRIAKRLIPIALRPFVQREITKLFSLREKKRALKLQRRTPLQIHLGSAGTIKAGWVNIDMVGHPVDLIWNLENPLPFVDNVADALFHEHLLEHFSLERGFALTKDCYRVLKPEGVLRIGVPDAEAYIDAYVSGGDLLEPTRSKHPTRLLALLEVLSGHGHRVMYDLETLTLVLNASGFEKVERSAFGNSQIRPCPDSEHRRTGTLYVEAVK